MPAIIDTTKPTLSMSQRAQLFKRRLGAKSMNKYNKMREGKKKSLFAESGTPKMVSGVKKSVFGE